MYAKYETKSYIRPARGRNFFGGVGAKLDFVSFHKKGKGSAAGIISGQKAAVEELSLKFPSISRLPFLNDEADPEKSWWKRQVYRARMPQRK